MKTVEFVTAQHVKIEYELASTGMRIAASLIDLFAFFIYFMFTGFLFGNTFLFFEAGISELISLILIQLPWYFYSPIIEYFTKGQSLGKYTLGIRVVSISGENATLREYFTRWVFRIVDLWFGFGLLAILFSSSSPRAQRLGDVMANTVIIRKKSTVLYSLRNILSIKQQENHEPTYPNVIRFTDEDVMLIKTTIQRVEKYPTDETKKFAIELAKKTAELIGLPETPDKKLTFLKTVLLDYVVLTR
jgi:uncharacterized RDD family membrane protein YckC